MTTDLSFILVIDDSSTIRTLLAGMLSRHGHQALVVESVELALMDLKRQDFDLVITDIFMPGMGGIEGIQKIRAGWPGVGIIAISAGFEDMGKERALEAAAKQGADRTLAKPFTEEDLMVLVDELLGGGEKGEGDGKAAAS